MSTSSEQQSSSENRVELFNSSCSWRLVITILVLPIAKSVHLNYDQALGHFLQHDLLIAHGGLRHLQDTVQDGGSKCSRFSSCSPVQGSEVGPCLPEFTLLTILFFLHLADYAVTSNKDNKGSHPLIFFLKDGFPRVFRTLPTVPLQTVVSRAIFICAS